MDKKMTYTDALNTAIDLVDAVNDGVAYDPVTDLSAVVEKLTALKEQLTKRNASKSDKPTKTQRENAEIKARILEFLSHTLQGVKCGDVATACGISSGQKCSALLKQLVDSGEVVKRMDKRTALFLLPENDCTREDVE